jgi:hypothetical protein
MFAKLLRTITLLLPFIEQADDYFEGKTNDEPDFLKKLPDGPMKSEIAMERARRRVG